MIYPKLDNISEGILTYTDAQIVRIIGYDDIFPDREVPSIEILLKDIPREKIVKVVHLLANNYNNADIETMQFFFSPENTALKNDFNNGFLKRFETDTTPHIFCTLQTCVELLKQAFAIPYKQQKLKQDGFEENILNAILVINDTLTKFNDKRSSNDPLVRLAELMVVNSFSQKDINNSDVNETFRELFTKSIDFFEYASEDEYFKPIYQRFLENFKIDDFRNYLNTILAMYVFIRENGIIGTFDYNQVSDVDKLIHIHVLDYISLPVIKDIPLDENIDYIEFREKPLIKIDEGIYEIINTGFLFEKLFTGLYFDFRIIAKELNLNGFENQFKQGFMEKTLLYRYVEIINKNKQYTAVSGKESFAQRKKGEDGEPDYYLRSKTGDIILFENKDISINRKIKESRELETIISEYKNKLLIKTMSGNEIVKNPKKVGIGQLVNHIKKIQNNLAFWDKEVTNDCKIYPVLVLGDPRIIPDGMPYLLQKWYEDACITHEVKILNVKPLIVITISTLLLYSDEFNRDGFECYFDEYFESMEQAKKLKGDPFLMISNLSVSFSEYMNRVHPRNFTDIYENYFKRFGLQHKTKTH